MASVERTAYPVLPSQLPAKELHRSYSLSDSEIEWVNNTAKSPALSIGLAIQLKVFQQLHYLVELEDATPEQLFISAVLPTRQQVPNRVRVFLDRLEAVLSDSK